MQQILETAVRSICIIVGLFVITKMLGKKQLSGLSFFEYIVGITVGDIAGTLSMDGNLSLIDGVTSIIIWSFFPLLISILSLKSKWFRTFVTGTPTPFIENGKILEENLRKEKFTIDELLEQLRKRNVFQVSDVEYALLDTNGQLGIFLKKSKQPLTYGDLFPQTDHIKPPETIVVDGKIEKKGLLKFGLSEQWLHSKLLEIKLSIDEVFFAQVDSNGNLTIDTYDDARHSTSNEPPENILKDLRNIINELSKHTLINKNSNANEEIQGFMRDIKELEARLSHLLERGLEKR